MKREEILKMAVALTAAELAGPGCVPLIVNGPQSLGRRITEYAAIVESVARDSNVPVEEDDA